MHVRLIGNQKIIVSKENFSRLQSLKNETRGLFVLSILLSDQNMKLLLFMTFLFTCGIHVSQSYILQVGLVIDSPALSQYKSIEKATQKALDALLKTNQILKENYNLHIQVVDVQHIDIRPYAPTWSLFYYDYYFPAWTRNSDKVVQLAKERFTIVVTHHGTAVGAHKDENNWFLKKAGTACVPDGTPAFVNLNGWIIVAKSFALAIFKGLGGWSGCTCSGCIIDENSNKMTIPSNCLSISDGLKCIGNSNSRSAKSYPICGNTIQENGETCECEDGLSGCSKDTSASQCYNGYCKFEPIPDPKPKPVSSTTPATSTTKKKVKTKRRTTTTTTATEDSTPEDEETAGPAAAVDGPQQSGSRVGLWIGVTVLALLVCAAIGTVLMKKIHARRTALKLKNQPSMKSSKSSKGSDVSSFFK